MSTNTERILAELAGANGGAVGRSDAAAHGVGRSGLHRRQQSGLLVPVTTSAFIHTGYRSDRSVLHALALAYPEGAVARRSALALAGLPVTEQPFHFVVPHGRRPDRPRFHELSDVLIHETRHLPVADKRLVDGLPVTSAARTLVDIAPWESDAFLVHLAESALVNGSLTSVGMIACLGERRRRGAKGAGRLGQLLVDTLTDEDLADSTFVLHVLRGLRDQGIEDLIPQFQPPWFDGVRGITDVGCPLGSTIVECDGRSFRKVTASHDNDRRRDRMAAAHGFVTVRIGYREFYRDPEAVCCEVAGIIRDRRALAAAKRAA
mgnify:CR=1 FL=1